MGHRLTPIGHPLKHDRHVAQPPLAAPPRVEVVGREEQVLVPHLPVVAEPVREEQRLATEEPKLGGGIEEAIGLGRIARVL